MKQLIIMALFSAFVFTSNAQSTNFQYGVKAGANVSALTGEHGGATDNLNSWYAGLQANFPFSKTFAFQPELIYSREGFKSEGAKYHFDFVRMPIAFQLRHESGVYAELGAQFGVKVKSELAYPDQKVEIPEMEMFNAGLLMGVGYRHVSGLGANVRFAPGITNTGREVASKLVSLSFGISYSFDSK